MPLQFWITILILIHLYPQSPSLQSAIGNPAHWSQRNVPVVYCTQCIKHPCYRSRRVHVIPPVAPGTEIVVVAGQHNWMRFTTLFLIQVPWRIARKIPVVSGHWKWKVASSDLKHRCLFIGPSNAPVWYLFCVTCHNLNQAVDHRKRNKEKLFLPSTKANSGTVLLQFNGHPR